MPIATFCGLPHSESEVYYVKSTAIGPAPTEGGPRAIGVQCAVGAAASLSTRRCSKNGSVAAGAEFTTGDVATWAMTQQMLQER